jgi:chromosomal replication initiator protein
LVARYTFENFVVGKSNRLAHAGAMAVANSPGTIYNPLFLYGPSGLGKTHLLHAIGHAARARNPHIRLGLTDGESFTAHYVSALKEHRTEEFRRQNRRVDIWLVDDIQTIAGREQTKEEFFHTFNALYQTGRQIVIASDRSPRELRTMDERLRSRFECGLIADISTPELETRVAILEKRCSMETPPWQVPDEVIYLIAESIPSNMRALEGALTRLVAYSSVMKLPCTVELAQSVLSEFFTNHSSLPRRPSKGVAVEAILRAVAAEMHMSVEALLSPRRDKPTATARHVAMFLSRELTDAPLAQIGAAIGGRDHTTVQRAIAKISSSLPYDPSLRATVQKLRDKLDR